MQKNAQSEVQFPLKKRNIIIISIGIALLFIGNLILVPEDFIDVTQFSWALYIAPFFLMGGFIVIIYGIMAKAPKNTTE